MDDRVQEWGKLLKVIDPACQHHVVQDGSGSVMVCEGGFFWSS